MCGRLDEDGGHLLLKCKEVKKVWRELNLEQVRCRLSEAQSARQMMEMILKMKGKEQLTVVMLLWLWWGERNKWREEGDELHQTWLMLLLSMLISPRKLMAGCCRKTDRGHTGKNQRRVN
jgi:hypothetical protein